MRVKQKRNKRTSSANRAKVGQVAETLKRLPTIGVRLTKPERRLIERAAQVASRKKLRRITLSTFIREASVAAAQAETGEAA